MDPQNTNQGQSHIIFYCIAGLIAVLIFPPLVGLSVYYKNKKQKEKKKKLILLDFVRFSWL